AAIEGQPLWNNRQDDHGPFDIIGDVHGCFDELVELLGKLGYAVDEGRTTKDEGRMVTGERVTCNVSSETGRAEGTPDYASHAPDDAHPSSFVATCPAGNRPSSGRKAVFLGDLVDRGPRIPDVLR